MKLLKPKKKRVEGSDMKTCRITVMKRHFDEELAKEYGVKGLGKCPMHKEFVTWQ
jgi:hypothetical protein